MSKLPKLKVNSSFLGEPTDDICELEQAKYRFSYSSETLMVVEGHVVKSYEELVQLATNDHYKNKEFLEVVLLPALISGG